MWDSPNNLRLAQRMPAVYRCGADPSPGNLGETSYLAVVGKKTVFPEAESRSIAHVRDGLHATLMVVECHDSGVGWAEPKDLHAGALRFGVSGKRSGKQLSLRSDHPTVAHVLMADGQPLLLPDDISPDVLDALSTIRGFEEIPWDLMPASR